MASKQDNYLRMHHPSIWKGMKKGGKVENYKCGGKVKKKHKYYAEGGKNTDTVPAMLTPGEVVLNAEQQEALGELVGMKPAALFEKIGIPGFAGGGVATKEDALVQYYEDGGVEDREPPIPFVGKDYDPSPSLMRRINPFYEPGRQTALARDKFFKTKHEDIFEPRSRPPGQVKEEPGGFISPVLYTRRGLPGGKGIGTASPLEYEGALGRRRKKKDEGEAYPIDYSKKWEVGKIK